MRPGTIVAAGLALAAACTAQPAPSGTPGVTEATPTAGEASPTLTLAPQAAEATSPPEPTNTPYYTPPPFSAVSISDDFFFEGLDLDCPLPCWQGLMVGESGRDEIQHVFDTVFAFNGTRDFLPENVQGRTVPGIYGTGWSWITNEEADQHFGIGVWVDEESYLLRGIHFDWSSNAMDANMTPQRIIEHLGEPSYATVSVARSEVATHGNLTLTLIYDRGLAFYLPVGAPITITSTEEGYDESLLLCLSGPAWSSSEYAIDYAKRAYLMEPLSAGLDDLTPLQEYFIGHDGSSPLQELFGVTLAEVTQRVRQGEEVCLTAFLR